MMDWENIPISWWEWDESIIIKNAETALYPANHKYVKSAYSLSKITQQAYVELSSWPCSLKHKCYSTSSQLFLLQTISTLSLHLILDFAKGFFPSNQY